jgi:hypothetical protein
VFKRSLRSGRRAHGGDPDPHRLAAVKAVLRLAGGAGLPHLSCGLSRQPLRRRSGPTAVAWSNGRLTGNATTAHRVGFGLEQSLALWVHRRSVEAIPKRSLFGLEMVELPIGLILHMLVFSGRNGPVAAHVVKAQPGREALYKRVYGSPPDLLARFKSRNRTDRSSAAKVELIRAARREVLIGGRNG